MNGTQEKQKSECVQNATVLIGTRKRILKNRLCKCGCGNFAAQNKQTKQYNHYIQGHNRKIINYDPLRKCAVNGCERIVCRKTLIYCSRHHSQIRKFGKIRERTMYDKNSYEFKDGLCFIDLYNRKGVLVAVTFIDELDFDLIKNIKWGLKKDRPGCRGPIQSMPDILLNRPDGFVIDHINRNPLDNRRCNLRICKQSENTLNSKVRNYSKSQIKGVYMSPNGKTWGAYISRFGHIHRLGTFTSPQAAIEARNAVAIQLHGQYAYIDSFKGDV